MGFKIQLAMQLNMGETTNLVYVTHHQLVFKNILFCAGNMFAEHLPTSYIYIYKISRNDTTLQDKKSFGFIDKYFPFQYVLNDIHG